MSSLCVEYIPPHAHVLVHCFFRTSNAFGIVITDAFPIVCNGIIPKQISTLVVVTGAD